MSIQNISNALLHFREEIENIINVLDKLLKIINHSDPSAEEKKKIFYQKYLEQIHQISEEIKKQCSWKEVQDGIKWIVDQNEEKTTISNREKISQKLLKDLQSCWFKKPTFPEFQKKTSKPPMRKKNVSSKFSQIKPTHSISEQKKSVEPFYTKESLMDMVKMTKNERKARKDLIKVIGKIKALDPENIERKIKTWIQNNTQTK